MKTLVLTIFVFIFGIQVSAKESHVSKAQKEAHKHDHKHKHSGDHKMGADLKKITKTSATVKVKGMVCAFCAQGIEKNFKKREEVKSTKVDLDKMEVVIHFKEGKSLDEKMIKEVVEGAGFSYVGLKNDK